MFINNREWEMQILSGIEHLVHLLIETSYARGPKKENLLKQATTHLRDLNPLLLKLIDGREELLDSLIRQLFSQKLPPGFLFTSFGGLKHDLDYVIRQALLPLPPVLEDIEPPVLEPVFRNSPLAANPDANASPGGAPEELVPVETAPESIPPESTPPVSISADSPLAEDIPVPYPENISAKGTDIQAASVPSVPFIPAQTAPVQTEPSLFDILANLYPREKILMNYVFRSILFDYYLPDKKIAFIILRPQKKILPFHRLLLKKEGITLIEVNPRELSNVRLLIRNLPKF